MAHMADQRDNPLISKNMLVNIKSTDMQADDVLTLS